MKCSACNLTKIFPCSLNRHGESGAANTETVKRGHARDISCGERSNFREEGCMDEARKFKN